LNEVVFEHNQFNVARGLGRLFMLLLFTMFFMYYELVSVRTSAR